MAEPPAQIVAGRDLFAPVVEGQIFLAPAPRPEAVDQHPSFCAGSS